MHTRYASRRKEQGWAVLVSILIHVAIVVLFLWVMSGRMPVSGNGPLSVNMTEEDAVYDEENEKEKHEVQITHQSLPPVRMEALDYTPNEVPAMSPVYIPPPDLGSMLVSIDEDPLDVGSDMGEMLEDDLFEKGETSEVFSAPVGGNSVAFVIDVSTSMPRQIGTAGVNALKQQLQLAINALPDEQMFNVICFGNKADGLFNKPTAASPTAKALAAKFMADYFTGKFTRSRTGDYGRAGRAHGISYVPIEPEDVPYMSKTSGGSRYDLALVAAFQQKASTIYLVTDGTPSTLKKTWLGTNKAMARDDIINVVYKAAHELYGKKLPQLHCIGIDSAGEGYLTQLAAAFRSNYKKIRAGESWARPR